MTSPRSQLLGPTTVAAALGAGATIIDGRAPEVFDAGHVSGAVNVPAGDDSGALTACLVGRDVPVIAVSDDPDEAAGIADQLDLAGFRSVLGAASAAAAGPGLGRHRLQRSGAVEVGRLAAELATGAVLLVDVRDAWESCEGRIPGSVHLPLTNLRAAAHLLPAVPTVTVCTDGRRAAAGASALRRFGHRNVWRLAGAGVPELLARPIGLDLLGAA